MWIIKTAKLFYTEPLWSQKIEDAYIFYHYLDALNTATRLNKILEEIASCYVIRIDSALEHQIKLNKEKNALINCGLSE